MIPLSRSNSYCWDTGVSFQTWNRRFNTYHFNILAFVADNASDSDCSSASRHMHFMQRTLLFDFTLGKRIPHFYLSYHFNMENENFPHTHIICRLGNQECSCRAKFLIYIVLYSRIFYSLLLWIFLTGCQRVLKGFRRLLERYHFQIHCSHILDRRTAFLPWLLL